MHHQGQVRWESRFICPPTGARDATELPTCCFVHDLSKSRPDVLTVPARLPNAFSADDHAGHVPGDRPSLGLAMPAEAMAVAWSRWLTPHTADIRE